jgi:uncharacterized protein (DUF1697 family)
MQTYIALLRGINVGGNNKVDMKVLKALFESIGYKKVSTYINSGNVIFNSKETKTTTIAAKIERELQKAFGFEMRVVVRDRDNILKVAKTVPKTWENNAEQKTDVLFLWEEFDSKDTLLLIKQTKGVDTLKYVDGAIIWNVDKRHFNKTGMKNFIGTPLYKHMTARNVNTVRKIAALLRIE